MQISTEVREKLKRFNQEHLIQFWDELSETEQSALQKQIDEIDFQLMNRLIQQRSQRSPLESGADRAARAQAPEQLVRLPRTPEDHQRELEATQAGEQLLQQGKVGAILVAGGQGSRLGFDAPKGMFPIGPVTQRTLFQILCEQLLARSRRAGSPIPYFIMTSEATHLQTVEFFEKNNYFGLDKNHVAFFQQASLPAVDDSSHRILLEGKGRIATSPDGHGGMLRALQRAGILDIIRDRGIEHLYYHQVDNPTAIMCDPALLGHHLLAGSDMTTKVVAKVSPEEKMGVLATIDGRTEIIEYSDLPLGQARRLQPDGTLVFWAGNTAIHVFKRSFIEQLLANDLSLPFHIAHKKVPYVDETGTLVSPSEPNANKFEQFIFDALPHARKALVVEGERSREFNPVKNAEGSDSPATSRGALLRLAREWITAAGCKVTDDVRVEISPLFALDENELKEKLSAGQEISDGTVLN